MMIDLSELKAISIRQPWCFHILNDCKDVENRTWKTKFRGDVLIHAGKQFDGHKVDQRNFEEINHTKLDMGGIVGIMNIYACVDQWHSQWFQGPYGFLIRNVQPVPFIPCKGALSFFNPNLPKGIYHVER